jgi:hypothetical protein
MQVLGTIVLTFLSSSHKVTRGMSNTPPSDKSKVQKVHHHFNIVGSSRDFCPFLRFYRFSFDSEPDKRVLENGWHHCSCKHTLFYNFPFSMCVYTCINLLKTIYYYIIMNARNHTGTSFTLNILDKLVTIKSLRW